MSRPSRIKKTKDLNRPKKVEYHYTREVMEFRYKPLTWLYHFLRMDIACIIVPLLVYAIAIIIACINGLFTVRSSAGNSEGVKIIAIILGILIITYLIIVVTHTVIPKLMVILFKAKLNKCEIQVELNDESIRIIDGYTKKEVKYSDIKSVSIAVRPDIIGKLYPEKLNKRMITLRGMGQKKLAVLPADLGDFMTVLNRKVPSLGLNEQTVPVIVDAMPSVGDDIAEIIADSIVDSITSDN